MSMEIIICFNKLASFTSTYNIQSPTAQAIVTPFYTGFRHSPTDT